MRIDDNPGGFLSYKGERDRFAAEFWQCFLRGAVEWHAARMNEDGA